MLRTQQDQHRAPSWTDNKVPAPITFAVLGALIIVAVLTAFPGRLLAFETPATTASDDADRVANIQYASIAPYRNCTEARAAGAAPLELGEPGYGAHLDGDNDGVACEDYSPPAQPRAAARRSALGGESFSYRNCADARAAGAAPIRIGEPGYGPHLDGDNDGVACERARR